MSKIYIQHAACLLAYSGSVAGSGFVTASMYCDGYARLVGFLTSDGSSASEGASHFRLAQSVDHGTNFDYISASDTFGAAGGSAACTLNIVGDAVEFYYRAGDTNVDVLRAGFWLLPI